MVLAAGNQEVTGWRSTGEPLRAEIAKASFACLEDAGGAQPVRSSRAHQDQFAFDNATEKLFPGFAPAVVPDGGGDQMLMHGERQGGGRTVVGHLANEMAHFAVRQAAAAQVLGNHGRESAMFLKAHVIFPDKTALRIVSRRTRLE